MRQILAILFILTQLFCCKTKNSNSLVKKTYYPDGKIKSQTSLSNNYKNGLEINYFQNGMIQSLKNYSSGKLSGEQVWFYENGFIEQKRVFKDGIPYGHWYSYYPSGALEHFRYSLGGYDIAGVDYWDDTIGIIQSSLHFNDSGQIYYKKNFDRRGNLIGEEGSKTKNYR